MKITKHQNMSKQDRNHTPWRHKISLQLGLIWKSYKNYTLVWSSDEKGAAITTPHVTFIVSAFKEKPTTQFRALKLHHLVKMKQKYIFFFISECGKWPLSNNLTAKLAGENVELSKEERWQSLAYLIHVTDKTTCTVSIIGPRWLLTSHSCLAKG